MAFNPNVNLYTSVINSNTIRKNALLLSFPLSQADFSKKKGRLSSPFRCLAKITW